MDQILAIVLPVFGLIGIGYVVAWTKLLDHAAGDALSEFVFVVAIPLLIFRIVATADLAGISAWRLWLAFFAAFAWMVAAWVRAVGPRALLAAPLAWVAVELERTRTALHFPWCLLGYSQHADLHVIQVARYGAVYAVSALVCGVAAVAAYVALEPHAGRRRAAALIAVAVLALVYAHGWWRLRQPEAAAQLMAFSENHWTRHFGVLDQGDRHFVRVVRRLVRYQLGSAAADLAWQQGLRLSLPQAVALALSLADTPLR